MEAHRMFLRATTLLLAIGFASASIASPTGKVATGKQKAAPCAACHGDGNKTLNDTYPKLAGQYPEYLAKALHEYQSGKRKNAVMGGQAQALTEKEIADLSAYFGSLKPEIHDLSGHAR